MWEFRASRTYFLKQWQTNSFADYKFIRERGRGERGAGEERERVSKSESFLKKIPVVKYWYHSTWLPFQAQLSLVPDSGFTESNFFHSSKYVRHLWSQSSRTVQIAEQGRRACLENEHSIFWLLPELEHWQNTYLSSETGFSSLWCIYATPPPGCDARSVFELE